jgi:hypothetical protein
MLHEPNLDLPSYPESPACFSDSRISGNSGSTKLGREEHQHRRRLYHVHQPATRDSRSPATLGDRHNNRGSVCRSREPERSDPLHEVSWTQRTDRTRGRRCDFTVGPRWRHEYSDHRGGRTVLEKARSVVDHCGGQHPRDFYIGRLNDSGPLAIITGFRRVSRVSAQRNAANGPAAVLGESLRPQTGLVAAYLTAVSLRRGSLPMT